MSNSSLLAAVRWVDRRADADADRLAGRLALGERVAYATPGDLAAPTRGDQRELVGTVARDGIDQPHLVGERGGHVAENLVAGRGPGTVVDLGKAIDVEQQDAQQRFLSDRARDLELEHPLEGDLVGQPGE